MHSGGARMSELYEVVTLRERCNDLETFIDMTLQ